MDELVDIMQAAFEDELYQIKMASPAMDAAKHLGHAAKSLPLGSMAAGGALTIGAGRAHSDWKRGRQMRKQMQQGY